MADYESKARELVAKGDKKLRGFSLFGGNKYDEAAEFYEKAANQFKLAKACEHGAALPPAPAATVRPCFFLPLLPQFRTPDPPSSACPVASPSPARRLPIPCPSRPLGTPGTTWRPLPLCSSLPTAACPVATPGTHLHPPAAAGSESGDAYGDPHRPPTGACPRGTSGTHLHPPTNLQGTRPGTRM